MKAQEFMEVQLLSRVKGKGSEPGQLPKFGRPIAPEQETKYLGRQVGKLGRYEIWRDYIGSQVSYILVDPGEEGRRAVIIAFGSRYARNPNSFIIAGVYAAPGNPVKAHQFYHALITELGLTLISDYKQSPGGQSVWKNLGRRYRDISVFGYDTKNDQLLNVTADDEEMTHVQPGADTSREMKALARNIRLVATAK